MAEARNERRPTPRARSEQSIAERRPTPRARNEASSTEHDAARLIAWSHELRRAHARLTSALDVTRAALRDSESAADVANDLALYCLGFCTALDGHHRGEDSELFTAIAATHPELADTLRLLQQDHSMIAHLLGALQDAVRRSAPLVELQGHLDGIGAIMQSHFRYEERALSTVLETLRLSADPAQVLGPL